MKRHKRTQTAGAVYPPAGWATPLHLDDPKSDLELCGEKENMRAINMRQDRRSAVRALVGGLF